MEFAKHTMEDVSLDHNMEMSSDLRGPLDNQDEIEIDLDIAHDPVEDRDVDVVVDDASVAASDGAHDTSHDADMLDEEYSEGHTLQPEYHFNQEEQQQYLGDGEYHGEDTFEAEMEDDYEEDIDAPIPGTSTLEFQDAAQPPLPQQPEPSYPQHRESPAEDTSKSPVRTPPKSVSPQTRSPIPPIEEDSGQPLQLADDAEEKPQREEAPQGRELEQDGDAAESSSIVPPQQQVEQSDSDYHQEEEARESVEPEVHEGYEYDEATGTHEDGPGCAVAKVMDADVNLHNIKVIYQDAEISLFPPMEDDPTETYFLEDTGLAHEPINQLFQACRGVLSNHIDEDEELMLDIDCLNLHLSQSASQNSNVTLFQITQVYHRLCVNDGINTPEPLYLALSSSNSFDFVYRNLVEAAERGKGLSSIESWDGYEKYGREEIVESRDGDDTGTLDEHEEGFTEPSHTKLAEPENDQAEPADDEVAGHRERMLHEAEQETTGTLEVSDIPSEHAGYAEPVDNQSEQHVAPAMPHDLGEEDAANVEGAAEPGAVDEAIEVARHEEGEDDRQQEHVDFQEEASQAKQQPFIDDTQAIEGKDAYAEDSTIPRDAAEQYAQEPHEDYAEWETAEPEWRAEEAIEQPEDAVATRSATATVGDGNEDDGQPADIETVVDDSAGNQETDVRQPEITFDETVIDITGEDYDQEDKVPQTTNGQSQNTLSAYAGQQPGTPETSHSLFDVEEDIFKSPAAEKTAVTPSAVDLATEQIPETGEPEVVVLDEDYTGSPDLESGEVVPSENGDFQLLDEKPLGEGSPTSAKRPRSDDDADAEEPSAPESKRRRSG